jgi:hypothetical protein
MSIWGPTEDTDEKVRRWMKAKGWEVTSTDYDSEAGVYAWRRELAGSNSPTLRIARSVLEDYPAFALVEILDNLRVAGAIKTRPAAHLVVVQKGLRVVLEER